MPPKGNPLKGKGKEKSIAKPKPVSDGSPEASSSSCNTDEARKKYEAELSWCIRKLQISLGSGRLNSSKFQDAAKMLRILMNKSAPVGKKRQIMRMTCGDYRKLMAEEEKKIDKVNSHVKLYVPKIRPQSTFLKKATCLKSKTDFKFNFEAPEGPVTEDINKLSLENPKPAPKNGFHFEQSDNSFRFNFEEISQ